MEIKSSKFVLSVANKGGLCCFDKPQFAFVGRSNVGKSSLINSLARCKIAKTSQTPGRTRLVNYFLMNDQFYLVDLPGYGYHKASKSDESAWVPLIESYLSNNSSLKICFVLVDCRHQPTENDVLMIKYLYYYQIPFQIVATKCDKLSRAALDKNLGMIASALAVGKGDILPFSQEKQLGRQQILDMIEMRI